MKKKSNNLLTIIGVILVIVVLIAFFSVSMKKEEKIKIGAIIFLTGPQAYIGEEVRNALVLANELDNVKSEKKIELVVEDSQDNPATAISAYNKLRLENIPAIISAGDQVSFALSPIANRDKVVLMITVAASGQISGEYIFRAFLRAEQDANIIAEYATQDLKLKKFGVIYINNVYGDTYFRKFKDIVNQNGGEVLSVEAFNIIDTDVRTQILKTTSKNPDAIVIVGFGPAYPIIFKQLREYGWQGIILTINEITNPNQLNAIGRQNVNNTYFTETLFDSYNPTTEQMKFFVDKYKEKFGVEPQFFAAFAFEAYNVLSSVIRECGYNSEKIKICLFQVKDREGILGKIDFSTHEMKVPFYVKKVEDGKFIIKKMIS